MSDFILDYRNKDQRIPPDLVGEFKYFDDIQIQYFEFEDFSFGISRTDDLSIWAPYQSPDKRYFIALNGRVAFEEMQWNEGKKVLGEGGVACKIIFSNFIEEGIQSLSKLNGNYTAIIFDKEKSVIYVSMDKSGMTPCFYNVQSVNQGVICSHPDVLAKVINEKNNMDQVSITEFITTGQVSFPNTYYKNIKSLEFGSTFSINLKDSKEKLRREIDYKLDFEIDPSISEKEMAFKLTEAFKNAVSKRTLPLFGNTAISLSGGLDSRAILCGADNREELDTFCFYDEENLEFNLAKQIAKEARVNFIPIPRDFEHYGNNAELGVKISGGMSNIGNNHYLGFRKIFKDLGINNILTGFYCDYFFKSLVLDKKVRKISGKEVLTNYLDQTYQPYHWFDNPWNEEIRSRLELKFPQGLKNDYSNLGYLEKEKKRFIPLYYEPDSAETVVPQRAMEFFLPIVDNDILDVYHKIPPNYKLNLSVFSKMVENICGDKISRIININNGSRVNAPFLNIFFNRYKKKVFDRFRKKNKLATNESWPNWQYYVRHSSTIKRLWEKKNPVSDQILNSILNVPHWKNYQQTDVRLFLRMLTLKIWLDQQTDNS
jgi:hypothetical protein